MILDSTLLFESLFSVGFGLPSGLNPFTTPEFVIRIKKKKNMLLVELRESPLPLTSFSKVFVDHGMSKFIIRFFTLQGR